MKTTSMAIAACLAVLAAACGGSQEQRITATPTAEVATPESDRTTPQATPTPMSSEEALAYAMSACRQGFDQSYGSVVAAYPELEGIRNQISETNANLCVRGVTLICQGASDEAIIAASEEACVQIKSLTAQVGLQYDTCTETESQFLLDSRANILALTGCTP